MVGPATAPQYDVYARRIGRWEGVSVRERINTGRDGHIIDFRFAWPGVPPAEPDERRFDDVRNSAVIWRNPESVKQWQLRLPPLPVSPNPDAEDVQGKLERGLSAGSQVPQQITVLLADGTQAWMPHVQPKGYTVHVDNPDDVLDLIHTIWANYRSMTDSEGVIQ